MSAKGSDGLSNVKKWIAYTLIRGRCFGKREKKTVGGN
jgi:hypothetical protein